MFKLTSKHPEPEFKCTSIYDSCPECLSESELNCPNCNAPYSESWMNGCCGTELTVDECKKILKEQGKCNGK